MKTINEQELKIILDNHGMWLRNEENGERADLSDADLNSANLSGADIRFANLSNSSLSYANLNFANLSSANLSSANLSNSNLNSANLSFANFSKANLNSANLRSANLSSANLSSADLRFANLSDANLSNSNLLIFQFNRNSAYFTLDGTMRIGCGCMPISDWVIGYKEIGEKQGYTPIEIEAYGDFIKLCLNAFNAQNPK